MIKTSVRTIVLTEENERNLGKAIAQRLITTGRMKGNISDIVNEALTLWIKQKTTTCPRCNSEFITGTDVLITNCPKCGKFVHPR